MSNDSAPMNSLANLTASLEIAAHSVCVPKHHNSDAPNNAKYYVVVLGHTTGIFRDWDDAKESVSGFSGCKFKGFSRSVDAITYWDNNCRRNHKTTHHPELEPVSASLTSPSILSTTTVVTSSISSTQSRKSATSTAPLQCPSLPTSESLPSPQPARIKHCSTAPNAPRPATPCPDPPPASPQPRTGQSVSLSVTPSPMKDSIGSTDAVPSIGTSPPPSTFVRTSCSASSDSTLSSPTSLSSSASSSGSIEIVYGVAVVGLHAIYSDRAIAYGAFRQYLVRHLEPDFHCGTFEEVAVKLSKTFQFTFYTVAGASQEGIYTSLYRAHSAFIESFAQQGEAHMYIDGDFDVAYRRHNR